MVAAAFLATKTIANAMASPNADSSVDAGKTDPIFKRVRLATTKNRSVNARFVDTMRSRLLFNDCALFDDVHAVDP